MILLDALIIICVLIGFILGFKDGFVRKLVGFAGFIIAIVAAVFLASRLGYMIESLLRIEYYLAEIIGGVLIFLVVLGFFMVIKRIVHPFDRVNNLINQVTGGLAGSIQILFFLSAIFVILNVFNLPERETKQRSVFYNDTYSIIPLTIQYLSYYTPQPRKLIENYINEKDTLK